MRAPWTSLAEWKGDLALIEIPLSVSAMQDGSLCSFVGDASDRLKIAIVAAEDHSNSLSRPWVFVFGSYGLTVIVPTLVRLAAASEFPK
jgi:hypothetical protein